MTTVLVMAKAPVAGQAKTRLAADLSGNRAAAAELAAASLLDTIAACAGAVGPGRCRLAVAGELRQAAQREALHGALAGWDVVAQEGDGLDERLANALAAVPGPVVQIGMDTPQVTPAMLHRLVAALDRYDAVLAPASDGGWWALGLRSGIDGELLRGVPMSTGTTYAATYAALRSADLRIGTAPTLTDVDHLAEARIVAAEAPHGRFAQALRSLDPGRLAS